MIEKSTGEEHQGRRYYSCDSSQQFLNFSRDFLAVPKQQSASYYQDGLKDLVVFKSEVTLVDQEQNHRCRIL